MVLLVHIKMKLQKQKIMNIQNILTEMPSEYEVAW